MILGVASFKWPLAWPLSPSQYCGLFQVAISLASPLGLSPLTDTGPSLEAKGGGGGGGAFVPATGGGGILHENDGKVPELPFFF